MSDRDVEAEVEANERRAADGDRARDDGPGSLIADTVGSLLRPADEERVDDDEAEARRAENDAEQRPS